MKKACLIAAIATVFAAPAVFAQQTGTAAQGKTRAEVRAELEKAIADGSYASMHSESAERVLNFVSTKTRAQVVAELKQAQRDGTYTGTVLDASYPATAYAPRKARADVVSEMAHARTDGSLVKMNKEFYSN